MKVTLVRPPNALPFKSTIEDALPPLGLAYLAATLKEGGHTVIAIDAVEEGLHYWDKIEGWPNILRHGLSIQEMTNRIPPDTDLIGVTCMFSATWTYVHLVLTEIRAHFKNIPIVIGGEHVTAVPEYILKSCQAVDYCILGEGEGPLLALANTLAETKSPAEICKRVPGLVGLVNGEIVYGPSSKRILDIDQLPPPDWSIFPVEKYLDGGFHYGLDRGRSMPFLVSRGCPCSCTFCSSPKMWTTLWKPR